MIPTFPCFLSRAYFSESTVEAVDVLLIYHPVCADFVVIGLPFFQIPVGIGTGPAASDRDASVCAVPGR